MKNLSRTDDPVVVGGFTPLTTLDYPGELAAVVFLQGCPWRCGYCQNTDLIARKNSSVIPWSDVIKLLEKRIGLLDAVVFSGGEPTMHSGLAEAMRQIKSMGYKIGLHSAGIYPDRLNKLLPLIDWIGLDIKSTKQDYAHITGVRGSGDSAWKSAKLVIESGVSYEFRTTAHPDMLSEEQLLALTDELTKLGAKNYVIQQCVIKYCLDEARRVSWKNRPDGIFINQLSDKFDRFSIRTL